MPRISGIARDVGSEKRKRITGASHASNPARKEKRSTPPAAIDLPGWDYVDLFTLSGSAAGGDSFSFDTGLEGDVFLVLGAAFDWSIGATPDPGDVGQITFDMFGTLGGSNLVSDQVGDGRVSGTGVWAASSNPSGLLIVHGPPSVQALTVNWTAYINVWRYTGEAA